MYFLVYKANMLSIFVTNITLKISSSIPSVAGVNKYIEIKLGH